MAAKNVENESFFSTRLTPLFINSPGLITALTKIHCRDITIGPGFAFTPPFHLMILVEIKPLS